MAHSLSTMQSPSLLPLCTPSKWLPSTQWVQAHLQQIMQLQLMEVSLYKYKHVLWSARLYAMHEQMTLLVLCKADCTCVCLSVCVSAMRALVSCAISVKLAVVAEGTRGQVLAGSPNLRFAELSFHFRCSFAGDHHFLIIVPLTFGFYRTDSLSSHG